jgi:hypothetical protein
MQRLIPDALAIPMNERGLRVRFVPGSEPGTNGSTRPITEMQSGIRRAHRTDKSNSDKMVNMVRSKSLKAQGKALMHSVLTEVSLRHS